MIILTRLPYPNAIVVVPDKHKHDIKDQTDLNTLNFYRSKELKNKLEVTAESSKHFVYRILNFTLEDRVMKYYRKCLKCLFFSL